MAPRSISYRIVSCISSDIVNIVQYRHDVCLITHPASRNAANTNMCRIVSLLLSLSLSSISLSLSYRYRVLSCRYRYRIGIVIVIVSYRIVQYRRDCKYRVVSCGPSHPHHLLSYRIVSSLSKWISYRIVSWALKAEVLSYRIVSSPFHEISYRIVSSHLDAMTTMAHSNHSTLASQINRCMTMMMTMLH